MSGRHWTRTLKRIGACAAAADADDAAAADDADDAIRRPGARWREAYSADWLRKNVLRPALVQPEEVAR